MKIKATMERIPGGMMLVPLLLGAILNTLAPETGNYFGSFTKGMISGTVPILAVWFFCIGASIDLRATGTVLRKTGLLGIVLGVAVIIITGIPLIMADKFLGGGNGTAGVAASSAAGAAVANPVIIAQINPAFEPVAASATALVAASVIVTAILVPIITALYARHVAKQPPVTQGAESVTTSTLHR